MSPKAAESQKLIYNKEKEAGLLKELQHFRTAYAYQHQLMHFLTRCMYEVSRDPVDHTDVFFLTDNIFNGNNRLHLCIHVSELVEKKECAAAEMQWIQTRCSEVHEMLMEVLKARMELLHLDI